MRYPLNMLHLIVNFISRDKMSSDNPQIEKNKSDIVLFLKLPSTGQRKLFDGDTASRQKRLGCPVKSEAKEVSWMIYSDWMWSECWWWLAQRWEAAKKKTGVGTVRWNKSRPDWPKSDRKGQVTWLSVEGARTKYWNLINGSPMTVGAQLIVATREIKKKYQSGLTAHTWDLKS